LQCLISLRGEEQHLCHISSHKGKREIERENPKKSTSKAHFVLFGDMTGGGIALHFCKKITVFVHSADLPGVKCSAKSVLGFGQQALLV